jgi:hypothetical protein
MQIGHTLDEQEKVSVKWMKKHCIHIMKHCTHNIPMGRTGENEAEVNTIYNTPCDILHTFECGLFKNVILWIMTVIVNISKLNKTGKYLFSTSLLDIRLSSFKYLPKVPNVTLYYFRKGISFIMKNKGSKELLMSTGGAGGFRSVEYVTLLIQIFMAVSNCIHFK